MPISLPLYIEIFQEHNCLDNLQAFCWYDSLPQINIHSENGADCFRLPRNTGKLIAKKEPWVYVATSPPSFAF